VRVHVHSGAQRQRGDLADREAQRHAAAVGTRVVALVVDREACGVLDLLGVTAEVTVISGR
jgi:hypothetical protein